MDLRPMLDKISMLEGSLPNTTRSEVIHSRCMLMMAEVTVKQLIVVAEVADQIRKIAANLPNDPLAKAEMAAPRKPTQTPPPGGGTPKPTDTQEKVQDPKPAEKKLDTLSGNVSTNQESLAGLAEFDLPAKSK